MTTLQLLEWLVKEESSAYGECCGEALDKLHADGCVNYFSARTGGLLAKPLDGYTRVYVTKKGHNTLRDMRASQHAARAAQRDAEAEGK